MKLAPLALIGPVAVASALVILHFPILPSSPHDLTEDFLRKDRDLAIFIFQAPRYVRPSTVLRGGKSCKTRQTIPRIPSAVLLPSLLVITRYICRNQGRLSWST